jgi:hypothetical protein
MRFLVILSLCTFLFCNSDAQKTDTLGDKTIVIFDNHGKIVIIDNSNVDKQPDLSADIRPVSNRIEQQVLKNLKTLKQNYPTKWVRLFIEAGSTMRDTVAKTIDKYISQFDIGGYSAGAIVMTQSTHPIEIICGKSTESFVKDLLSALSPLLKNRYFILSNDAAGDMAQITIVGTPFYSKNGAITLR